MRTLILLVVIATAGAGIWFVAFDSATPGAPGSPYGEGEEAGTGGEPRGEDPDAGLREIADVPLVGVVDRSSGVTLPPVDPENALTTLLRFDTSAKQVDGAAWLAVIEAQCGRRLPIRFASQATWSRFRGLVIFNKVPPEPVDLRTTLQAIRDHGWEAEVIEQDSFLMLHPKRSP